MLLTCCGSPSCNYPTEKRLFGVDGHSIWVHAERLVHRLVPRNEPQRRAVELVRQLVWWFYADLEAHKRDPCPRRRAALRARFDRIFRRRTGFVALDRLLARLHARKEELLVVLERPEVPLHTNHRGPVIRLRLEKRLALEWARGERPMPFWWRMTPDTNMAHGLRRA